MSAPESLSWRDPHGYVVKTEGRILRAVAPGKAKQTRELIGAHWLTKFFADGRIPKTVELLELPAGVERADQWLWLEHVPLEFPCYPHEIAALQLYDSALLTLDIATEAVRHGWVLKDASAWNVLHDRGRAIFVDLLSFDRVPPTETWVPYGQFCRHFLLPLLLYRKRGVTPAEIFLTHRDGMTPDQAYRLLGAARWTSWSALELVVLPKMLTNAGSRLIASQSAKKPRPIDSNFARLRVVGTLERLRRMLEGLRPEGNKSPSRSIWRAYESDRPHYSDADLSVKRQFVKDALVGCNTVIDFGCNAGEFSLVAADCGKTVVAADLDHEALSVLYARIRGRGVGVMPIILNLGRPTPAIGWENREVGSFIDRATGRFDCVLMLGLIHHLLVTERVTVAMLVAFLEGLRPKTLILEWVDSNDPRFVQIAGLNASLYAHLTAGDFENRLLHHFRLTRKLALACGTRTLYLWER